MTKAIKDERFLGLSHLAIICSMLFASFLLIATLAARESYAQWLTPSPINDQFRLQVKGIVKSFPTRLLKAENRSNAQSFIDAIHGSASDKAFFLYRMHQGRLVLHAQSSPLPGYLPSPILANHTANLTNWLEIRRIIQIENDDAGLLIAAMNKPKLDLEFLALLLLVSLIFALLLTKVASKLINRSIGDTLNPLIADADKITRNRRFEKRLAASKFGPLSSIAVLFNSLFKRIAQLNKLKHELEQSNSQLTEDMDSKISERTNALRVAMEEAEQANESKSTFLATMSHEIRTPMNGIIGSIDLLRNGQLNQNQFRLSDTIRESAYSLLRIIDDILDFSKIEAGKLEVESIPMSINDIIEAVGRTLLPVATQKRIELRLYCDPAIHDGLMGDPIRIRQILFNLAGNAIKFTKSTPDRKGVVQIRAEIVDTNMEFTNILLKVIDNGKGMTERQVNYVFQPFNQAEGTVTRQFGGTGLGLTICQRLTDLMYGQINVRSVLGQGSEFSVSLPLRSSLDKNFIKTYDFTRLTLTCFSTDAMHSEAIGQYCQFHGASVTRVTTIEDLSHQADHFRADAGVRQLWVLDATSNRHELMQLLQRLLTIESCQRIRFLILNSSLDPQGLEHERVWYSHAMPLCRTSLYEAICDVLANKRSQGQDREKKASCKPTGRLSLQQAKEQNRLVLLAEDNSMNQQVISEQLNMLGYAVEVANDGQEAIDMWRKFPYPLVLTDLHMPNKSGYDVVQTIRKEDPKANGAERTRVIAVTANALKGEEQKCIKLGMDGYLTKPLELSDLEVVVKKWLNIDQASTTITSNVVALTANQEDGTPPIQESILIGYLGNDIKRHRRYLNMFNTKGQEIMTEIASQLDRQERDRIKELAHQFKSMSKSVGAMPLYSLALELQNQAQSADNETLYTLYSQLTEQFALALTHISHHYPVGPDGKNQNAS